MHPQKVYRRTHSNWGGPGIHPGGGHKNIDLQHTTDESTQFLCPPRLFSRRAEGARGTPRGGVKNAPRAETHLGRAETPHGAPLRGAPKMVKNSAKKNIHAAVQFFGVRGAPPGAGRPSGAPRARKGARNPPPPPQGGKKCAPRPRVHASARPLLQTLCPPNIVGLFLANLSDFRQF